MFTGIIQNQGIVEKKDTRAGQARFRFRFLKPERRKLEIGQSIAVNGVCLTAACAGASSFEVDVIRETLEGTTLGGLEIGDRVNLERPLRYGDPVGGHFVTGHVDACGQIECAERRGKNLSFEIRAPRSVKRFIVPKGSIAVDGVSLTVQSAKGYSFRVGLVPHTLKTTTLGRKTRGGRVNLEADRMARYENQ